MVVLAWIYDQRNFACTVWTPLVEGSFLNRRIVRFL
jgi:hypothetical protein